jgi:hypothetical protein
VNHQLALRPDALAAYRSLRADPSGELGKRVKAALERLIDDPGAVRAESARWESLSGKVWSLSVSDPDDGIWVILWAEQSSGIIEVFYIGPAPGETPSATAWTSQTE